MPGPPYAYATANDNVCYVRWNVEAKIPGCLGFSIHRIPVSAGASMPASEPLRSPVGFSGAVAPGEPETKSTDIWPVQRFEWIDSDLPGGVRVKYRIVPMLGRPGALHPADSLAMETGVVCLADDFGAIKVTFTRGLIDLGGGGANPADLARLAAPPANEPSQAVRARLGARAIHAVTSFLAQAREKGRILAALHKLTDKGLSEALAQLGDRVELVLCNADASETYVGEDGRKHMRNLYDNINYKHRRRLVQTSAVKVTSRFLPAGSVGHNNFAIYVDENNVPRSVLTGSIEWTALGLCTEIGNLVVLRSPEVAERYQRYWTSLKNGVNLAPRRLVQAPPRPNSSHSDDFRALSASLARATAICEGSVQTWFSPNCRPQAKSTHLTPPDLQEVLDLMDRAKKSILFLSSGPGGPSIAQRIRETHRERLRSGRRIYVAGAATDPLGAGQFVEVFHRGTSHFVQGPARSRVVGIGNVGDTFSQWSFALQQGGGREIRDTVIVIDHWDAENCVVITGSHNLNRRSSCWNEENLIILKGVRDVALAFATHILDVTLFYRWRWHLQQDAKCPVTKRGDVWGALEEKDAWQDKYFSSDHPAYHDAALLSPTFREDPMGVQACSLRG